MKPVRLARWGREGWFLGLGSIVIVANASGQRYFHSPFACFDAAVVVAEFIVDVLLKGVLADVGSLVVVLRL